MPMVVEAVGIMCIGNVPFSDSVYAVDYVTVEINRVS